MINTVIVLLAIFRIQTYSHGYAFISLADEMIMIKTVVFPIYHNPRVHFVTLGIIVIVDYDLGNAGIIC